MRARVRNGLTVPSPRHTPFLYKNVQNREIPNVKNSVKMCFIFFFWVNLESLAHLQFVYVCFRAIYEELAPNENKNNAITHAHTYTHKYQNKHLSSRANTHTHTSYPI